MVIDYKDLHGRIIDTIESYTSHSFEHVNRTNWIDGEGKFPEALVGGSFSVFVDGVRDDEELINQNDALLSLNIQFALDGNHDNYLDDLGYCTDVIYNLQNITGSNFQIQKVLPHFTCEVNNQFVLVDFAEVLFTIKNK